LSCTDLFGTLNLSIKIIIMIVNSTAFRFVQYICVVFVACLLVVSCARKGIDSSGSMETSIPDDSVPVTPPVSPPDDLSPPVSPPADPSPPIGEPIQDNGEGYVVDWGGYGGDDQASQYSEYPIADGFSIQQALQVPNGGIVYATPVIVSNAAGQNAVFMLAVNGSSSRVIKYYVEGSTFSAASGYVEPSFTIDSSKKTGYQIALSVEEDALYVYVAHSQGVSKVDGITGEVIATVEESNGAGRIRVSEGRVYYQTATDLVYANTDLTVQLRENIGYADLLRQIPIVVGDEGVYAAADSQVCRVDFQAVSVTKKCRSVTEGLHVSNMMGLLGEVVYTEQMMVPFSYVFFDPRFELLFRMVTSMQPVSFINGNTPYESFNKKFRFVLQKSSVNRDNFDLKQNYPRLGDVSFTAMAKRNNKVILPGFGSYRGLQNDLVAPNPFEWRDNDILDGPIAVTRTDSGISMQPLLPPQTLLIGYNYFYDSVNNNFYYKVFFDINYVSRFVIAYPEKIISVVNIPEYFHAEEDVFGEYIQRTRQSFSIDFDHEDVLINDPMYYKDGTVDVDASPRITEDKDPEGWPPTANAQIYHNIYKANKYYDNGYVFNDPNEEGFLLQEWFLPNQPGADTNFSSGPDSSKRNIPASDMIDTMNYYHTHVVMGHASAASMSKGPIPKDTAIISIAAGKAFVVLTGDDGSVYIVR
jgi:hypothetical protein